MKAIAILAALSLSACVTTVSPDGTKTTSFAPSIDQLHAAEGLVNAVKGGAVAVRQFEPVYGPLPVTPTK